MMRPRTDEQSSTTVPFAFRIINNQDTDLIIDYEEKNVYLY